MKTIKELSAEIGISKVSISKAIKRPEMKPYISKTDDNITIVNDDGVALIISYFNQEKAQTFSDIAESILIDDKAGSEDKQVLAVLKDELSQKNGEINSLLKIITNQQTIDGHRLVKDRHSQLLLANAMSPQPVQSRKAGILNWLFKRK
jgi:DNA-binding transcriptional regulator YhcF (GntR family)